MRDEKKLLNNKELENPPKIFIGAISGPFVEPLNIRIPRLAKKIGAGADFIQTQGIFDIEKFSIWMEKVRKLGLHEKTKILAGVIPLKSAENAVNLQNNNPGINIPKEIINRLKEVKNPQEEGILIAQDIIRNLKEIEGISGIHIISEIYEECISEILNDTGLLPRPKF
jgi:methylenetetrahydrofolate reductase (NADPH)